VWLKRSAGCTACRRAVARARPHAGSEHRRPSKAWLSSAGSSPTESGGGADRQRRRYGPLHSLWIDPHPGGGRAPRCAGRGRRAGARDVDVGPRSTAAAAGEGDTAMSSHGAVPARSCRPPVPDVEIAIVRRRSARRQPRRSAVRPPRLAAVRRGVTSSQGVHPLCQPPSALSPDAMALPPAQRSRLLRRPPGALGDPNSEGASDLQARRAKTGSTPEALFSTMRPGAAGADAAKPTSAMPLRVRRVRPSPGLGHRLHLHNGGERIEPTLVSPVSARISRRGVGDPGHRQRVDDATPRSLEGSPGSIPVGSGSSGSPCSALACSNRGVLSSRGHVIAHRRRCRVSPLARSTRRHMRQTGVGCAGGPVGSGPGKRSQVEPPQFCRTGAVRRTAKIKPVLQRIPPR
jgi:hypothetical protein